MYSRELRMSSVDYSSTFCRRNNTEYLGTSVGLIRKRIRLRPEMPSRADEPQPPAVPTIIAHPVT